MKTVHEPHEPLDEDYVVNIPVRDEATVARALADYLLAVLDRKELARVAVRKPKRKAARVNALDDESRGPEHMNDSADVANSGCSLDTVAAVKRARRRK